ncbi:YbdD/YjiX family protein [Brachybacterium nesterenkovii]|uniref:YbdD/YjiX family protein n=1 Tax=Brachybacterium nesterenkovii TaxID=47847 RepID=UPI0032192032
MSAPARAAAKLPDLLREVRRFARGILGSDAYDKYLAHHRVTGCAHAPMTEREFWRWMYAQQDASPEGRCC